MIPRHVFAAFSRIWSWPPRDPGLPLLLVLCGCLAACDPLLTIQGSFWPPWIVSMIGGLALTAVISWVLARLGLAPHLGPPLLIYPSLWAWMTFVFWLLAYAQ